MTKKLLMVMAATLICGTSVFTSCTVDNVDNAATPTIDGLSEKIIGKWITATDMDGQPTLTNNKEVITFVSPTKAYASRSRGNMNGGPQAPNPQDAPEGQGAPEGAGASAPMPAGAGGWDNYQECDVKIDGNTVILMSPGPDGSINSIKYQIVSISDSEFECEVIRDAPDGQMGLSPDEGNNGEAPMNAKQYQRFVKVAKDFKQDILGLWECTGLTGIETNNDANARLEFLADDTYKFWRKNDAGEWEAVTTREFQDYFVDGTLLATIWKNQGEDELREWWEIASIADGQMQWTALRQQTDGSTIQQGMTWKKIEKVD